MRKLSLIGRLPEPIRKMGFFCLAVFLMAALCANTEKKEGGKIVYLNFETGEDQLSSFFQGIVIEEKTEMPGVDFDIGLEPPPPLRITLESGLREKIVILERENTIAGGRDKNEN